MVQNDTHDLPRFSSPTPQVSTSKCLANSAPEGEISFAVVIRLHWLQCAAPLPSATLDSPQRPQCVAQLWAQANACRMHRLNQTESDWILDALQCHNVNLDLTEVCEQFARSAHLHVLSFIMIVKSPVYKSKSVPARNAPFLVTDPGLTCEEP